MKAYDKYLFGMTDALVRMFNLWPEIEREMLA